MGLGKFFKAVVGGADKALDVAGKLHIPIAEQIDTAKDLIKDHVKAGSISETDAARIAASLDGAKSDALAAIAAAKDLPTSAKGIFESKRAVAAISGIVSVGLVHFLHLTPDTAAQMSQAIMVLVGLYIAAETARTSMK